MSYLAALFIVLLLLAAAMAIPPLSTCIRFGLWREAAKGAGLIAACLVLAGLWVWAAQ